MRGLFKSRNEQQLKGMGWFGGGGGEGREKDDRKNSVFLPESLWGPFKGDKFP